MTTRGVTPYTRNKVRSYFAYVQFELQDCIFLEKSIKSSHMQIAMQVLSVGNPWLGARTVGKHSHFDFNQSYCLLCPTSRGFCHFPLQWNDIFPAEQKSRSFRSLQEYTCKWVILYSIVRINFSEIDNICNAQIALC